MAIHFLPHEETGMGGLANALGGLTALGGGALAGYASKQINMPDKIKKFEAFGATKDQAKALANSSEVQQTAWLKEAMKAQQKAQQAQMFSNIVSGGQQQPMQQPATAQPQAPLAGMDAMSALGGQQQNQIPQPGQQAPDIGQLLNTKTVSELQQYRDKILKSGGDPQLIKDATMLLDREIDTKLKQEGMAQKEKQLASKEKTDAFKITAPYRAELAKESESTSHILDVLEEQEKLSKSGKMTNSGFLEGLEKIGWDLNILKSPETEAYQALEKEHLKDLKNIFGGKVSNIEMQTFMRGIPKATNTPEGRKLITDRLRSYYKAKNLRFNTMRKIVKENNGIPPLDLQDQVAERMASEKLKKKVDQYTNEFRGIPKDGQLVQDEDTGEYAIMMPNGEIRPYKPGV